MPVDAETFDQGRNRYSIENEILGFLQDNPERAYNLHEITVEVMAIDWAESNVDSDQFEEVVGCVLDLATVNSILDHLVDNGQVDRRVLDHGQGERSYYRAP